jgi:hypothetical protein
MEQSASLKKMNDKMTTLRNELNSSRQKSSSLRSASKHNNHGGGDSVDNDKQMQIDALEKKLQQRQV